MNVLTDLEIDALWVTAPDDQDGNDFVPFARAIEAAVIKRLAAGVSVEPKGKRLAYRCAAGAGEDEYEDFYTPEQFTTAIAEARVQMNERIVKLCKKRWKGGYPQEVIDDLVTAIHALLGAKT